MSGIIPATTLLLPRRETHAWFTNYILPTAKGSGGLPGIGGASVEKKWLSVETVLGELQSNTGPALLLVDEAHVLPPDLARPLLHTVQRCFRQGSPLLVLLAGTPGLPSNLSKADASFWERATRLKIGRLETDDAVREALRRPAEKSGFPIDDDALELLVLESQAYPNTVKLTPTLTIRGVTWRPLVGVGLAV